MPGVNGYYDDRNMSRPRDYDPYDRHDGRRQEPYIPRSDYGRDPYPQRREEMMGREPKDSRYFSNGYSTNQRQETIDAYRENPLQTYELDHLATFSVGSKQGLLYAEDGVRKLRLMESTTGIWTMRCTLIIDRRCLIINDKQTGEEMERFPLQQVSDPTAVITNDRKDIYNNIILFTVLEDPSKQSPTEMHIFQAVNKPAQNVVDEIKLAQSGRGGYGGGRLPPHPMAPAPEPPINGGMNVRDRASEFDAIAMQQAEAARAYSPGPKPSRITKESFYHADDADSTMSERTDRDVQLLNHCFDDIEKFVGRLQQAAESYKELERRRRARDNRKGGRKGQGDGMLSMRARPPPARDFIDIFQKFKLSFNLLARLKAHIHDPNAPELVHFLFTPLSLVVEASKDPRHGTPDLASKVVSPLLNREAKDLLTNCLTSRESMLWMSLGEAWTTSREQWKGHVHPYYPRFWDGWEPSPDFLGEDGGAGASLAAAAAAQAEQARRRDERERARNQDYGRHQDYRHHGGGGLDYPTQQRPTSPMPSRPLSPRPQSPPPMMSQRPVSPPAPPPPPPQGPPAAASNYGSHANLMRELRSRTQNKEAQQRPGRSDPYASAAGLSAAMPSGASDESQKDFVRSLQNRSAKIYEVVHERQGKNSKELTVQKGEILEVLDDTRNWWKLRNSRGDAGHAPYTILKPYDPKADSNSAPNPAPYSDRGDPDPYSDRYDGGRDGPSNYNHSNYIPQAPPPPPPVGAGARGRKGEFRYF